MSLKYFFPSFLVLLVVILLGVKNYEIWNYPFELSEENGLTRKQGKDPEAARITMGSQRDPISIASYVFIAEKNIFNPERKDFPVRPVETSKQNVRPQVILYGVSIAEDYQAASIINPGRALRKGERETMTLKVGEKSENISWQRSSRIVLLWNRMGTPLKSSYMIQGTQRKEWR